MAMTEQAPAPSGLIARIKEILYTPDAAWTRIEAEPTTAKELFVGYACILAAIGPVAQLVGSQLFGYHALWISYHPPLISSIVSAIVNYVAGLVGVFAFALIIDALAPQFGGEKNQIQALKVAVYASTAAWIVGVFQLVYMVSALGIIGAYSLYLLYLGLPKLMKAPARPAKAPAAAASVTVRVIRASPLV